MFPEVDYLFRFDCYQFLFWLKIHIFRNCLSDSEQVYGKERISVIFLHWVFSALFLCIISVQ